MATAVNNDANNSKNAAVRPAPDGWYARRAVGIVGGQLLVFALFVAYMCAADLFTRSELNICTTTFCGLRGL